MGSWADTYGKMMKMNSGYSDGGLFDQPDAQYDQSAILEFLQQQALIQQQSQMALQNNQLRNTNPQLALAQKAGQSITSAFARPQAAPASAINQPTSNSGGDPQTAEYLKAVNADWDKLLAANMSKSKNPGEAYMATVNEIGAKYLASAPNPMASRLVQNVLASQAEKAHKLGYTAPTEIDRAKEERERAQAGNVTDSEVLKIPIGDKEVSFRPIKDKKGEITGYERFEGVKTNRNINTNFDGMTNPDKSKDVMNFVTLARANLDFLDSADRIEAAVDAGAKTGWVGSGVSVLDNALSGAKQIVSILDQNGMVEKEAKEYVTNVEPGWWSKMAKTTAISKSQYQELVFALAGVQNNHQQITKADVQAAQEQLGGALADPQKAKAVLRDVADRMPGKVQNYYDTIVDPKGRELVKPVYERFQTRYSEYSKQKPQPTGARIIRKID